MIALRLHVRQLIKTTGPSIGILERIQEDLIDETVGEKITPVKTSKSLVIVARKPLVPVILARIDSMLASLEKQRVSMDGVPRDLLNREAMDELEKVTKTIILMDQGLNVSSHALQQFGSNLTQTDCSH